MRSKVWVIGLLLAFFYLLIFLAFSSSFIAFPYQLDYGEGVVANLSLSLSRGVNLYSAPVSPPYIYTTYPPVFIAFYSLLIKLAGFSFAVGRFISFLSALGISFLIYQILKLKTSGNFAVSFFFALLFLSHPFIFWWSSLVRVDLLAIFFIFLAFYLVLKYEEKDSWHYYLTFLPLVLAFYTKQTSIGAVISILLYLFLKDRKKGLRAILICAVLLIVPLVVLTLLTGGAFFQQVLGRVPFGFSFSLLGFFYLLFLQSSILLIVGAVYYFIKASWQEKTLWLPYFILAMLISFSVGAVGSNINYFLELTAILCVLGGLAFDKLETMLKRPVFYVFFAVLIIQLVFIQGSFMIKESNFPSLNSSITKVLLPAAKSRKPVYLAEAEQTNQQAKDFLEKVSGPVLGENVGLLLLAKKEVYLGDPWLFRSLAEKGLWDENTLIRDIEAQKFTVILLENPFSGGRFSDRVLGAIEKHYYFKAEKMGFEYVGFPRQKLEKR